MSLRSYNDAIKNDPNSRLVISGGGLILTATAMRQNEAIWVAWDDGTGFYTTTAGKNIHVESDGTVTSPGNNSRYLAFAVSDILNGGFQCRAGYYITVYLNETSLGVKSLIMVEFLNGGSPDSLNDVFDYEGTQFWHKFEIDWTAQTFTVTFYTNALRTITAFTPKVISLTNDRAMQYIYGQQGHNQGVDGGGVSGFTQNFNQITPAIDLALVMPPALFQGASL